MNASFHRKIHLHPGSIKSHVNAYLQPEKLLFMHMLLLFVRSGPWFYKKQKGAPKDGVPSSLRAKSQRVCGMGVAKQFCENET